MEKEKIEQQITTLEAEMASPEFWQDKGRAQERVAEHARLKAELAGVGQYDKGNAIITIFAGAGGDDAEDWARMLFEMYTAFAKNRGFGLSIHHQNQNDHGGYRNITFTIQGPAAYGTLKSESGVHRLVRISPFNAKKQRHTSFSLVEVIPEFKREEVKIAAEDLQVEFARSSGPGGQNVNKRETSVRLTHIPTGLTVHCESERSQERNRELALQILRGKLYKLEADQRLAKEQGMYISKSTDNEWGSQIRSYVLHPYKMVKDHRTGVETSDITGVLEEGKIDLFLT